MRLVHHTAMGFRVKGQRQVASATLPRASGFRSWVSARWPAPHCHGLQGLGSRVRWPAPLCWVAWPRALPSGSCGVAGAEPHLGAAGGGGGAGALLVAALGGVPRGGAAVAVGQVPVGLRAGDLLAQQPVAVEGAAHLPAARWSARRDGRCTRISSASVRTLAPARVSRHGEALPALEAEAQAHSNSARLDQGLDRRCNAFSLCSCDLRH